MKLLYINVLPCFKNMMSKEAYIFAVAGPNAKDFISNGNLDPSYLVYQLVPN